MLRPGLDGTKTMNFNRFNQYIGKQYSFGQGMEFASMAENKEQQNTHLSIEDEILKKCSET